MSVMVSSLKLSGVMPRTFVMYLDTPRCMRRV
jgi:hypothetical protein